MKGAIVLNMQQDTANIYTVTQMTQLLGATRRQVVYALETRGQKPLRMIGSAAVYSESSFQIVKNALAGNARMAPAGSPHRLNMETTVGRGAAEFR
jgi:hypothetical protein